MVDRASKRAGYHDLLAPTYNSFREGLDTSDLQSAQQLLVQRRASFLGLMLH